MKIQLFSRHDGRTRTVHVHHLPRIGEDLVFMEKEIARRFRILRVNHYGALAGDPVVADGMTLVQVPSLEVEEVVLIDIKPKTPDGKPVS